MGIESIFLLFFFYLSLRFVLGEQLREPPEVLRVLEQSADLGERGRTRRRGQLGDADGGRGRRRRRWVHGFSFLCVEGGERRREREERRFFSSLFSFSYPSPPIRYDTKVVHLQQK